MSINSLLNRDTVFFLIADILFYCTSSVVGSFLGILIASKIAPGRLDAVGFVFTVYQIGYALAPLSVGYITRKIKRSHKRYIVSVAYLISGFLTILLGFANNLIFISIFFGITGFFDGLAYPLKNTIYSKIIKKGSDEKSWSLLSFANTAVPALLLIPISILTNENTIPILFAFSGSLTIFAGIFFGKIEVFEKEFLTHEKIEKKELLVNTY